MSDQIKKLIQSESDMAFGTSSVKIDLTSDSSVSTVSMFLRSFRGRADYANALPRSHDDFTSRIEQVRTSISVGSIEEAEQLLCLFKPSSLIEEGEYALELVRVHIGFDRIDEALRVSEIALANRHLADTSRMTIHQMRGHCFLIRQSFTEAVSELKQAITLAEIYTLASSAMSARAFLVVVYCKMLNREAAELELKALNSTIEAIVDPELWFDRLLLLTRADAHIQRTNGNYGAERMTLLEGICIADWLQDKSTSDKCKLELLQIPTDVATDGEVDQQIFSFDAWTYLKRHKAIASFAPRAVVHLKAHPKLGHLMDLLVERKELSYGKIFETVWGLNYVPERHETHIRATLSKLRKLIPEGSLSVRGGIVSLR